MGWRLNLGNKVFKVWIFPTACFILFLYIMGFTLVYTYSSNFGSNFTDQPKVRGDIDADAVKREIMKLRG